METKKQKMAKVRYNGAFCIFPNPLDALEEIRVFLTEQHDGIMGVSLVNMSMAEFDALPEFSGW